MGRKLEKWEKMEEIEKLGKWKRLRPFFLYKIDKM